MVAIRRLTVHMAQQRGRLRIIRTQARTNRALSCNSLRPAKLGQAYNPYTGTYAATRQGSSPPTGVVGSILCVERK